MMQCNRIVANVFRKHLKQFDITDSQLSILFIVTKAKAVNQKRIADALYLEKSTVNRNLKRLIDKGYITYIEGNQLRITDQGLQFLEQVIPHWDQAMEEIRAILNPDGETALNLIAFKLKQ